jgi:hypothetical protein
MSDGMVSMLPLDQPLSSREREPTNRPRRFLLQVRT